MQLVLKASYNSAQLGVDDIGDGTALVVENGVARLLYVDETVNKAYSTSLGTLSAPGSGYMTPDLLADSAEWTLIQPNGGMALEQTGGQTRAYIYGSHTGALTMTMLGTTGAPGTATIVGTSNGTLSGIETFSVIERSASDLAVLTKWNTPGLTIYEVSSTGFLTQTATLVDTSKSYLGNVSDSASLSIGSADYLLTLSSLEDGMTIYTVNAAGQATLNDSLGTHDGLAVGGPAAMQLVQVAGETFAIVASTGSSSLTSVRINDMGCLFIEDQLVDDLSTRFAHTEALDAFTMNGRSFIVTAGTDAGISFIEVLPGGEFQAFYSVPLETGTGLAAVTSVDAAVSGTTAQIFVIDATSEQIRQYELAMNDLGPCVMGSGTRTQGTTLGDLIIGGSGAETLQGLQGNDFIHDGAGADTLYGGAGEDVFVFGLDSSTDRLADYEPNIDVIDVSDWGRFYTADALTIKSTPTGAEISFGSNVLVVTSLSGTSLSVASFTDSDFIF